MKEKIGGNLTLVELITGVVLFAVVCQMVGVFFVNDKWDYSLGLWIGAAMASGMAIHMDYALKKTLLLDPESATKVARKDSMIRYFLVVLILGVIMVLRFANPLSAFLGLMGLKIAAYGQPLIHKLFQKFIKEEKHENIS